MQQGEPLLHTSLGRSQNPCWKLFRWLAGEGKPFHDGKPETINPFVSNHDKPEQFKARNIKLDSATTAARWTLQERD